MEPPQLLEDKNGAKAYSSWGINTSMYFTLSSLTPDMSTTLKLVFGIMNVHIKAMAESRPTNADSIYLIKIGTLLNLQVFLTTR